MFLPGTLGLLMLSLTAGLLALARKRTAVFGAALLASATGVYWLLGMPTTAFYFCQLVSGDYMPLTAAPGDMPIRAIVVLDGGTTTYVADGEELGVVTAPSAARALEAVRLYRLLDPELVVVTAGAYGEPRRLPEGSALRRVLVDAGVPPDRIILDSVSRNTREHASNMTALLAKSGIRRFALVTSLVHMRRALWAFSDAGAAVIPAPAPLERLDEPGWWPSTRALNSSVEAWHEVFGLLRDWVIPYDRASAETAAPQ